MRTAALAAGACLLLAAATPAHAQFRGRLTSRPQTPSAAPRSPTAQPLPILPVWWHWGVVVLPEPITLAPPGISDDAPTGGVQLDVLPWSAEVYVDGVRTGRVEDFRGYYQHLTLPAGPHVVAIVHPGYDPLVMDVVVVPGRTITWRAALSR
jgi:PEGA domain